MSSSTKTESPATGVDCKLTCDFELLRRSPVFTGTNNEVLKLFAYLAKRKKFRQGDFIITSGRDATEAYYLFSGNAEIIALHRGKEVVLQQLAPRVFFGELALLARYVWFISVRALTECEVLVITRESFNKVVEKFPENRTEMVEKIVQLRVERLNAQTHFILDNLADPLLLTQSANSANIPI